ncbi:MAG: hypothetical protein ACFB5Z_00430 [Elainellaceae cyanobacterium]
MIMLLYGLPSMLTFALLLRDFHQDHTTSMDDVDSWLVLFLAAALWPIVTLIRFKAR